MTNGLAMTYLRRLTNYLYEMRQAVGTPSISIIVSVQGNNQTYLLCEIGHATRCHQHARLMEVTLSLRTVGVLVRQGQ